MTYYTLLACVLACFVQNAVSQVISLNNCGPQQPLNLGNLGVTLGNQGLSMANGGNGICLNNAGLLGKGLTLANSPSFIGNVPTNCNNQIIQGTSQQIGYGDVAIVGEVPVAGPTAVCGNVPVIGYVIFEGDVPAGGMVSVVDPCGCNCNQ